MNSRIFKGFHHHRIFQKDYKGKQYLAEQYSVTCVQMTKDGIVKWIGLIGASIPKFCIHVYESYIEIVLFIV